MSDDIVTREELAAMLNVNRSYISALCSKSKRSLIPNPDNPDLIDLTVEKNRTYVKRRITENNLGVKPKRPIGRKKKEEKKETEPKKRGRKPAPKTEQETTIPKEQDRKANDLMRAMDVAKKRKVVAEAELKELELKKAKGDLVSANSIAPLIKNLSTTRDEKMKTETLSLIKDLAVEYGLEGDFAGKFEREFILLMNKTNKDTITEFAKNFDKAMS